MKKKTVLGITLSRLIGLAIFLLILGLLNFIQFDSLVNLQVVDFLNQNLLIIIILSVLFYLGELFFIFRFPMNILAPMFEALGAIFLVEFIFQIFYMIGDVLGQNPFFAFRFLKPFAFILVFILVITFGYIRVLTGLYSKDKKMKKAKQKGIEWEDVGEEFKMAMYNLTSSIKESLEPKKRKK